MQAGCCGYKMILMSFNIAYDNSNHRSPNREEYYFDWLIATSPYFWQETHNRAKYTRRARLRGHVTRRGREKVGTVCSFVLL